MNTNQNQPLVSIIALCYNQADYLEETLNSILAQSYRNIEIIITDDASKDNSVEKIKQWISNNNIKCSFLQHEQNKGLCATLNEALGHCKGKYYQPIACDDLMMPEKIAKQVALFESSDEDVAVVYSDAYLIDKNGDSLYGWFIQSFRHFSHLPSGNIYNDLLIGNFIPAMSVLIKTEVVKELGGYDEELFFEDYDLWLRISKNKVFLYSDYPSVKYRLHETNMHKASLRMLEDTYKIYKKHPETTAAKIRLKNQVHAVFKRDKKSWVLKDYLSKNIDDVAFRISIKLGLSFLWYKRLEKIVGRRA